MTAKAPPLSDRSTTKPVSLMALSVQLRSTWVAETTLAARLLGAAGAVPVQSTVAIFE